MENLRESWENLACIGASNMIRPLLSWGINFVELFVGGFKLTCFWRSKELWGRVRFVGDVGGFDKTQQSNPMIISTHTHT